MPDYIDKSNALDWASKHSTNERITRFCEMLTQYGSDDVPTELLTNLLSDNNGCWFCIEKTKPRQETRSFEVYFIDRKFIEVRATKVIAALCKRDRDGLVKVNYWCDLESTIKGIDPYATIRRF
jgi:hypothetical protein